MEIIENKNKINAKVKCSNKKIITLLTLLLCVSLLLSGCLKNCPAPTDSEPETTTAETAKEEAPSPTLSYDELLAMLNDIIAEKDFCDGANDLIFKTFDGLYDNYDDWKAVYRDLPRKDIFILDNFLEPLSELQRFLFYYKDSEEGKKLIEEGTPAGYTEILDDGGLGILVLAHRPGDDNEYMQMCDREVLLHELTHCNQTIEKDIKYDTDTYEEYLGEIITIFAEGGATFNQRFTIEYSEEKYASEYICTSDELFEIAYENIDGIGYPPELNLYTKFMYLAGYDAMFKLQKDELSFQDMTEMMYEKYGREQMDRFLKASLELTYQRISENRWKGDDLYELSVESEKLFLDFIYSDIERASTLNELSEAERLYRGYIAIGLPLAQKLQNPDEVFGEDITAELFNTDRIEKLLETKAKELS